MPVENGVKTKILVVAIVLSIALILGCKTVAYGELDVMVQGQGTGPLGGAKVVSDTQPEGQLKVTGLSDAQGRVVFKEIKPGEYEFYVSRFDYDQKEFTATVKAGETTSVTVVLTPSR